MVVRTIERITGSVGLLAAWLVAPLVIATCYEVFSRYVLDNPTLWAYEVGYMATGTNFLLGVAYTLRERGHIRIDVLYSHFSDRAKAIVDVVGILFFLLPATFWLCLKLWTYAYDAFLLGETTGESAWNPVVWPFRSMFFLGFAFLSLQAVAEVIKSYAVIAGRSPHPSTA